MLGRPTDEAIAAALARLEAKLAPPLRIESANSHTPDRTETRWAWPSRAGECYWCRRRGRQLLYRVYSRPTFTYDDDGPTGRRRLMEAVCLDGAECDAYRERQRELRSRRSGVKFQIVQPPFQGRHTERGWCWWCGEQIVLTDPETDYRRLSRQYHRGDDYETGDRDCLHEYLISYTYEARVAVVRRDLLDHGYVYCAECGLVCVELEEGRASRYGRDASEIPGASWEADHRIPLEDGGRHELDNLQCLCAPCHQAKTGRENRARAERRAKLPDREQSRPPRTHPPPAPSLAAAAAGDDRGRDPAHDPF